MRRILSIVGLASVLAAGVFAKDKNIVVKTDRFTGKTSIVMKAIAIGPLFGFEDRQRVSGKAVHFSLSLATEANASKDPYLAFFVTAGDWQFLKGADVHLLVDGEPIDLGHFVSIDTHVDSVAVVLTCETIGGPVSRAILDRMANAKDLQVKVGVYEIRLNAKNIAHLKEFSDALPNK